MNDVLSQALTDLTTWLRDEGFPFGLIGGLAVTVRGEPRVTMDVDVVLGVDVDQALRLLDQLPGSPFRPLFHDVADVVRHSFLMPLQHSKTGIRVDIALGLSGFEQNAIARASEVSFGLFRVPVVTAEDLILMKLLASRPRDTEDVHRIVQRQGDALDWDYLLETGRQLQEAVDQDLVPQLEQLQESSE